MIRHVDDRRLKALAPAPEEERGADDSGALRMQQVMPPASGDEVGQDDDCLAAVVALTVGLVEELEQRAHYRAVG